MVLGGASRDTTEFGSMEEGLSLVEAGTSGFLSISDSNCRVPEELGQEGKASSCVKECNFTCLSSCSRGDSPHLEL